MSNEKRPEKKRVMVSLTQEQFEKLEDIRAETGTTKSALVAVALNEWLVRHDIRRKGGGDIN